MNNRRLSIILCLFMIIGIFQVLVTVVPPNVAALTMYVGGGGSGNYTTIAEAVGYADDGDTIFVYSGTYVENVTITDSITLVGEDKDTTIIDGGDVHDTISIFEDQVTITGFTVSGGGDTIGYAGIGLSAVQNCHISENIISDNNGHGIRLSGSHFNVIENNVIRLNAASGISVQYSDRNTFLNNTFSHNTNGAWLREAGFNTFRENKFTHNTMYGLGGRDAYNNVIVDNLASDNYHGINFFESNNNQINSNVISDSEFGIYLFTATETRLQDNGLFRTRVSIYLAYTMYSTLSGNIMEKSGIVVEGGIRDSWTSLEIDSSNTVNGKPVYFVKNTGSLHVPSGYGQVIVAGGGGIYVENMEITDTSTAIQIGHSSNVFVLNNTLSGNTWNGVRFESVRHGYVNDNVIVSNGNRGISIWYSEATKVSRNYVANNTEFGIEVMMGAGNLVFHNTIIGNGTQGYNEGGNEWDLGYPAGGNYWSNYLGNDSLKGEFQDQPGSDGIGDHPYDLWNHRGTDWYPLMSPIVTAPPLEDGQPLCQIITPRDGSIVEGMVKIQGTASDIDGTVEKVELKREDTPWIEVDGTTSWTYEFDTDDNPNGEYTFHFRSFDGESYSEEDSITVMVLNLEKVQIPTYMWGIAVIVVVVLVLLMMMIVAYSKTGEREEEQQDMGEDEESED